MIGGGLMVLIGILYLAFEDAILGVSAKKYHLSRTVIGAQVGDSTYHVPAILTLLDRIDHSLHDYNPI
jgi:hypothetical protein